MGEKSTSREVRSKGGAGYSTCRSGKKKAKYPPVDPGLCGGSEG